MIICVESIRRDACHRSCILTLSWVHLCASACLQALYCSSSPTSAHPGCIGRCCARSSVIRPQVSDAVMCICRCLQLRLRRKEAQQTLLRPQYSCSCSSNSSSRRPLRPHRCPAQPTMALQSRGCRRGNARRPVEIELVEVVASGLSACIRIGVRRSRTRQSHLQYEVYR